MAKKKTGSKKGPAKKSATKKPAVKKVDAPVVEETPVAPATFDDTPVIKTEATDNQAENAVEDQGPDQEPEVAIIKMGVPVKLDDWRSRVIEEAKELKDKMVKLRAALDQNKVPADQIAILSKQYGIMNEYYIVLNTRLSN